MTAGPPAARAASAPQPAGTAGSRRPLGVSLLRDGVSSPPRGDLISAAEPQRRCGWAWHAAGRALGCGVINGTVSVPASCPICCHLSAVLGVRDSLSWGIHHASPMSPGRREILGVPGAVRDWVAAGKGAEEMDQCPTPVSEPNQPLSWCFPELFHWFHPRATTGTRHGPAMTPAWYPLLPCLSFPVPGLDLPARRGSSSRSDKQGAHSPSQAAKDTQINTDKHGLVHYFTRWPVYFRLAAEFRAVVAWGAAGRGLAGALMTL